VCRNKKSTKNKNWTYVSSWIRFITFGASSWLHVTATIHTCEVTPPVTQVTEPTKLAPSVAHPVIIVLVRKTIRTACNVPERPLLFCSATITVGHIKKSSHWAIQREFRIHQEIANLMTSQLWYCERNWKYDHLRIIYSLVGFKVHSKHIKTKYSR